MRFPGGLVCPLFQSVSEVEERLRHQMHASAFNGITKALSDFYTPRRLMTIFRC
jgi:hypothetical protein